MSCTPELVTGYVDGALDPAQRAEIETHLASCEACQAQASAERDVRGRLLSLLHPPLPAGFESRVRAHAFARRRVRLTRLLLPLAAAAALAFVWARRQPPAVAWELARDHDHCFRPRELPAQVWAEDAESILRWFESRGTTMPVVPNQAGGYGLIGARYCPLLDLTRAAHVYYRKENRKGVSIFVLGRTLSSPGPSLHVVRDHVVYVAQIGGVTVGVVGDSREDVQAFTRTFETTIATVSR